MLLNVLMPCVCLVLTTCECLLLMLCLYCCCCCFWKGSRTQFFSCSKQMATIGFYCITNWESYHSNVLNRQQWNIYRCCTEPRSCTFLSRPAEKWVSASSPGTRRYSCSSGGRSATETHSRKGGNVIKEYQFGIPKHTFNYTKDGYSR